MALEYNVPEYNLCNENGIQKLNLISNKKEMFIVTYNIIVEMMNNRYKLSTLSEEYAYVLSFGECRQLIAIYQISHNYPDSTTLRNRELFTFLLLSGAKEFFIVHNHPYGGGQCHSKSDIDVVKNIEKASELMDIDFVASIVINKDGYSVHEVNGWDDSWFAENF